MRPGAELQIWRAAEYREHRSKRRWQKRAKSPTSEVVLHPQADAEFLLAQGRARRRAHYAKVPLESVYAVGAMEWRTSHAETEVAGKCRSSAFIARTI